MTATDAQGPAAGPYVVVGSTPEARRTCAALRRRGFDVVHQEAPSDTELAEALAGPVRGLAVLIHHDTTALRYCLAAEHMAPGIRMFVALFDRTAARQLVEVVPNCTVMSPGDVALPSLVAACVSDDAAVLLHAGDHWTAHDRTGRGTPFALPSRTRARALVGRVLGQFRPHDSGSMLLFLGLSGLALILVVDTVIELVLLHEPLGLAVHAAVRTVTTAGPVPVDPDHPAYLWFASGAMLVTIGLTAMFTAGIVEHLLSGRLVGLLGRRVLPQRGHVVVVGMGQVGLRLAEELKALGLAVVGVDRDPQAPNLPIARSLNIPVHIGDASRRRVLHRVRVENAVAVCAVGSDELDNVAVSVTARALAPGIRIVMRAGTHDAIAETQSLFRIGTVCDVTGLTSAFVVSALTDDVPRAVMWSDGEFLALDLRSSSPTPVAAVDETCEHQR